MTEMKEGLISQIREIRHAISAECGHQVGQVATYYRRIEEELRVAGGYRFDEDPHASPETSPVQEKRF
jgi:hypothetical protein